MQLLRTNCTREGESTPVWAGLLAALLHDHSPEALLITIEAALMTFEAAQCSAPESRAKPPAHTPCPAPAAAQVSWANSLND